MGKRRAPRKISLSSELHLVSRAIDSVRILSQQWKEDHFTEEELPRLAHALHATVVLVRERLRLLDHVVRDTLDPLLLLADENRADEHLYADDSDVVLTAWSTKKTAERLRREVERAERCLQVLRGRSASKKRSKVA